MLDVKSFYFSRLNTALKKHIYYELYNLFSSGNALPCTIRCNPISEAELSEAIMALYLDHCELINMPPPHFFTLGFFRGGIVLNVSKKEYLEPIMSAQEIEACHAYAKKMFAIDVTEDYRVILNRITKKLHELAVYRRREDGIGESPDDIFFRHTAYCTGFARTLKWLADINNLNVVCVCGKLRRYRSAFLVNDLEGENHMFNAIYFEGKWLFFDPTAGATFANVRIKNELNRGQFRKSYATSEYTPLAFYDLSSVGKNYILEQEDIFLS